MSLLPLSNKLVKIFKTAFPNGHAIENRAADGRRSIRFFLSEQDNDPLSLSLVLTRVGGEMIELRYNQRHYTMNEEETTLLLSSHISIEEVIVDSFENAMISLQNQIENLLK